MTEKGKTNKIRRCILDTPHIINISVFVQCNIRNFVSYSNIRNDTGNSQVRGVVPKALFWRRSHMTTFAVRFRFNFNSQPVARAAALS